MKDFKVETYIHGEKDFKILSKDEVNHQITNGFFTKRNGKVYIDSKGRILKINPANGIGGLLFMCIVDFELIFKRDFLIVKWPELDEYLYVLKFSQFEDIQKILELKVKEIDDLNTSVSKTYKLSNDEILSVKYNKEKIDFCVVYQSVND